MGKLFFFVKSLNQVFHGRALASKFFARKSQPLGRNSNMSFGNLFWNQFLFRQLNFFLSFEQSFYRNLHKINETISNQLSKINNLELVSNKDFFGSNELLITGMCETSIMLITTLEQLADRNGDRHRQQKVISPY